MTIYIMMALCLLLFAFLSEIKYFQKKKIYQILFLIISSFMMFFVSAFRLNTGYDYAAYGKQFANILEKSLSEISGERMEKGYLLLNRYSQLISSHFQAIFVTSSFLVILLVSIILYKYCKNPTLGLLLFYLLGFYFNSMNFIRNVIAACIILYAYKYIREGNLLKFLIIVLLASTFHFSALLMIPFYFILRIKFNTFTFCVYGIIGGVIFAYSTPIIKFITTYVYKSYDPETSVHMFTGIRYQYVIFIGIILICVFLLRKEIKKHSEWGTILITSTFFDFYFGLLGVKHSLLSRFALYFGPIMALVLIPFIIRFLISKIINNSENRIIYKIRNYSCLILICTASISFFVFAILNNYNGVVPHDWIWNY